MLLLANGMNNACVALSTTSLKVRKNTQQQISLEAHQVVLAQWERLASLRLLATFNIIRYQVAESFVSPDTLYVKKHNRA
jgi:hypothetical protein